jgi:lipopolysaccharide export system protein LptC
LNSGISLFSDAGYELHTQSASLDLNQGVIHGHQEITGQGPMGTLRADQFHYDRDADQLLLQGHVHMTMVGKGK